MIKGRMVLQIKAIINQENHGLDMSCFKVAEIPHFNSQEREEYEARLKYYRDLTNTIDTARDEGVIKGKIEVAQNLFEIGLDNEKIAKATGLSNDEIVKLRKRSTK